MQPTLASQVVLMVKSLPANVADTRDGSLLPGLGKYPGVGNGTPLLYSYQENCMGRGAWQHSPWGHRVGHG